MQKCPTALAGAIRVGGEMHEAHKCDKSSDKSGDKSGNNSSDNSNDNSNDNSGNKS